MTLYNLINKNFDPFLAKATFAAISKTYSYLTPDMWKATVFTKTPYQEFTDFLAKNHTGQRAAAAKEQALKQQWKQSSERLK